MGNGVSVVIDGTTGVGKTSLIDILTERFDLSAYKEIFRDEHNLLGKFFEVGNRWCFPMQISFLNNRYAQYLAASELKNTVMDRSIFSDPIFADFYRKTGDMLPEEHYVYQTLFHSLIATLNPPQLVIYLEVSADEAICRIRQRGRAEELKMPDSYWYMLHEVYSHYYDNYKSSALLKINVEKLDFIKREADRELLMDIIQKHLPAKKI